MVGFRRERDRDVEVEILQVFQRVRKVIAQADADLAEHRVDEGVALAGSDAGRSRIEAAGIDLLGERSFTNLLTRVKGAATGGTPTGVHGTNIVSLKALPGGKALSASGENIIGASNELGFALTIADSGDSQEVGIEATLTIGEGAAAIKKTQTVELINAGEEKTVTFTNIGQVTFAQKLPIKVDVASVPGEHNTSNNSASYTAIFTVPG